MVQIYDLEYGYTSRVSLFRGLGLELERGRIYGLLGKNGAGKTTLLRLMCGLLFPRCGRVLIGGEEACGRGVEMLQRLFFVPEEFEMPSMSAFKYGELYGVFYPRYSGEEFGRLLGELEVDGSANMRQMSFGQKKKAMIAFALACGTELLIMDEPTNGMDIPSKATFRKIIASQMSDQRTIIISTHQVRDLEQLIDSVVILDNNKILLNATTERISQKLSFKHLSPDQPAIYSEQTPHGLWGVTLNQDNTESQVDLELLFNAAMTNKQLFQEQLSKTR